jgi:uncharacterized membrane protein YebE (DUF533 family)
MTDRHPDLLAVEWFYLEHFGFSKAPPQTDAEVVRNMALALVIAASGDGDLSQAERTWIRGYLSAKGYPAAIVAEVAAMSVSDIDALRELMQVGILSKSGRILIYDAIRASSADGYTEGERAAVRRAAQSLGIDEDGVAELEQLVEDEEALKTRRIRVLMPGGHPNLDPRYHAATS